jgi:hypothetical protein
MPRLFRGTKTQLGRIREEVRVFNRNIDRLERLYGTNQGLPEKISYDSVLERIQTENDFRRIVGYKNDANRRPSELQRFRSGVRSDAQRINPKTGNTFYVDREIKTSVRNINRQAKKEREARGIEWDTLTQRQKAMESAKGNIKPIDVSRFNTPKDLVKLQKMRKSVTPYNYMGNYINALRDNTASSPYREEIIDIITDLYNKDEDYVRSLLGGIDDEANIEYLYEAEKSLYKGIDNDTRMRNVYNYWKSKDRRG